MRKLGRWVLSLEAVMQKKVKNNSTSMKPGNKIISLNLIAFTTNNQTNLHMHNWFVFTKTNYSSG